jgi:hypothetical protein
MKKWRHKKYRIASQLAVVIKPIVQATDAGPLAGPVEELPTKHDGYTTQTLGTTKW